MRHLKHTFLRQFTDSLEGVHRQTVIWGLRAWAQQNIAVCLSVSLTFDHKGILPLVSGLYKIRQCLGLKHNFFRQRRTQVKTIQIGQHKENMWCRLRITLVTQVVSESVQCSKGFELKQQNLIACLSVCHKPTFSLLKTWLFSLITILYMLSVDRAFL